MIFKILDIAGKGADLLGKLNIFSMAYTGAKFVFKKLPKSVRRGLIAVLSILALMLLKVLVFLVIDLAWVFTYGTATITVEDIERNGTREDRVFTMDGVYINTDSMVRLKRNSADLRASLHRGKSYTCSTQGFRLRAGSYFPNLIDCELVSKQAVEAKSEANNSN